MPTSLEPLDLAATYLRLRADVSIEPLAVDATFWQRISTGQLGSFRNEYLVTLHTYSEKWPMWEMHPNGDEVVCLVSGAIDFVLEDDAGRRTVPLRSTGQYVIVPRGTWHTATPIAESCMLFITAGEGTQHRAAEW
jgi:mannose-6-phosphate isomerase-like protein (cupin superfamily)